MRGVGDKPLGIQEGVLQPSNHQIQRKGESLQFLGGLRHRQALAQVVLGDLLRFAGDLIDRRQRAPDQQVPPADGHEYGDRQPDGQENQKLVKHRLNRRHRRADFHDVTHAIGHRRIQCRDEQGLIVGKFLFPHGFLRRRGREGRQSSRVEALVRGRIRTIEYASVLTRDADEAVVDLGAYSDSISLATAASPVWFTFARSVSAICCARRTWASARLVSR